MAKGYTAAEAQRVLSRQVSPLSKAIIATDVAFRRAARRQSKRSPWGAYLEPEAG